MKVRDQINSLANIFSPPAEERIVITEGELDAASCYEVMSGWPMVSPTSWCGSSKKTCRKPYPSCKATKRSSSSSTTMKQGVRPLNLHSSILPASRVKIARLDAYKDASDALQAEDREAIRRAIWDAKPYRPDGIVDGKNLMALVTEPTKTCDHEYPFEGLNDKLHGIRCGEPLLLQLGQVVVDFIGGLSAFDLLAEKARQLVSLSLKQTTNARHWDLCPQPLVNPITLENMTKKNSSLLLLILLQSGMFFCLMALVALTQMLFTTGSSTLPVD